MGQTNVPAVSPRQQRYMAMLYRNPSMRTKAGISEKVAHEFSYKGDYEDDPAKRKKKRNALTESDDNG